MRPNAVLCGNGLRKLSVSLFKCSCLLNFNLVASKFVLKFNVFFIGQNGMKLCNEDFNLEHSGKKNSKVQKLLLKVYLFNSTEI